MAKILIIEDDPDFQHLLSVLFNREKYDVHYAFNGNEGYERILTLQPDVILLDLMLPGMSGVEIIRLVSTNALVRDIPIVVLTAHGDNEHMLETSLKAQGVREYVRKPCKFEALKHLVKRMLALYPRRPTAPAHVAKGIVRMDKKLRTVWINDRIVATLSPVKARLFEMLLEAKGPVKREKLLESVWGTSGSRNVLDKTIQRLREDIGTEASRIQTTAEGYELVG